MFKNEKKTSQFINSFFFNSLLARPSRILAHKFYTARIQELVTNLIQGKRDEQ